MITFCDADFVVKTPKSISAALKAGHSGSLSCTVGPPNESSVVGVSVLSSGEVLGLKMAGELAAGVPSLASEESLLESESTDFSIRDCFGFILLKYDVARVRDMGVLFVGSDHRLTAASRSTVKSGRRDPTNFEVELLIGGDSEGVEEEGSHDRFAKFVKASVVVLARPGDADLVSFDVSRLGVSERAGAASLDAAFDRGNHWRDLSINDPVRRRIGAGGRCDWLSILFPAAGCSKVKDLEFGSLRNVVSRLKSLLNEGSTNPLAEPRSGLCWAEVPYW